MTNPVLDFALGIAVVDLLLLAMLLARLLFLGHV